jgi:cytochrome c553
MSRRQIVLAAALGLLALLAVLLAVRTRGAPYLPDDPEHRSDSAVCMSCHGPDGPAPRSPNHPLGDDCFRCHARR